MRLPDGYGLIAKTQLLGTGDTVVRAYYHANDRDLMFEIQYTDERGKRTVQMGPLKKAHLGSLIQTLRDVSEMTIPFYITE